MQSLDYNIKNILIKFYILILFCIKNLEFLLYYEINAFLN